MDCLLLCTKPTALGFSPPGSHIIAQRAHSTPGCAEPPRILGSTSARASYRSYPHSFFLCPCRSTRMWRSSAVACEMTSRSTSSGRPVYFRTIQSWRRRTSACRNKCLCSGRTRRVSRVESPLGISVLSFTHLPLLCHGPHT